jgi:hypothetical protein
MAKLAETYQHKVDNFLLRIPHTVILPVDDQVGRNTF